MSIKRTDYFGLGSQQGGFRTRMLLVIITLVALTIGLLAVNGMFQKTQQVHHRNALRISDQGLQEALQKLQDRPSWTAGLNRTPCLDGWYSVSLSPSESAGVRSLSIVSEGHSGPLVSRQSAKLLLSINNGDSVWVEQSLKQE